MYTPNNSNEPTATTPSRAIAYCRKAAPGEHQNKSVAEQMKCCIEAAAEAGITLTDADILIEAPGYSASDWWAAATETPVPGRRRPILSKIVCDIQTSNITHLFVSSLDRLFRDVKMAQALISVFAHYGVRLYDRHGPIHLTTIDERYAILLSIAAAQMQQDICGKSSQRAIQRRLQAGELSTDPTALGFRSRGKHSGEVVHKVDEQSTVRYIFDLFLKRTDGEEPLGIEGIAARLTEEGFQWPADLHRKNGRTRNNFTSGVIYAFQVKKTLTFPLYVGKQQYGGQLYDCRAALLPCGETVIPQAVFDAAQAKLLRNRSGRKTSCQPQMLSLKVRCGLCGQAMHVRYSKDGNGGEKVAGYQVGQKRTWSWCDHSLPRIPVAALDAYVETVLQPWAWETVRAIQIQASRKVSGTSIGTTGETWESLPTTTRSEAIRSLVRWIAVIPVHPDAIASDDASMSIHASLVMLTTDGLYHTAQLWKQQLPDNESIEWRVAAATTPDAIGTVSEFPEPQCFIDGLRRTCSGQSLPFVLDEWAPGYDQTLPIAEFDE